jgi:transcription antitermination factor NusG
VSGPTLQIHPASTSAILPLCVATKEANWYAIHTVARHEKRVVEELQKKRICTFLPLLEQTHQWSDRRRRVEVPLFTCYAFVQMTPQPEERLQVLRTPGVLSMVGTRGQGTPIPDQEIENVRMVVREKISFGIHPFLAVGKRVRVRGGALDGLEGVLLERNLDRSVVISVELLRRSLSIRVEGYNLELA